MMGRMGASRNLRYNSLSYISNVPFEGVIDPCGKAGGKDDDDFSSSGVGRLFVELAFLVLRGSGSEDGRSSVVRFTLFLLRRLGLLLSPQLRLSTASTAAVDDIVNDG